MGIGANLKPFGRSLPAHLFLVAIRVALGRSISNRPASFPSHRDLSLHA